jgi:hypothetical protein
VTNHKIRHFFLVFVTFFVTFVTKWRFLSRFGTLRDIVASGSCIGVFLQQQTMEIRDEKQDLHIW